jgi:soluble lytic murein transglycosylase
LAIGLVLAAAGSVALVYLRWLYREQRYNQLIEQVAANYGVDKFLVKAVIHRESEFDPFAYGRAGEIGLMQVTEGAGWDWARATGRKDFGRDLLWDERANVEAGTWYLARAMRRWPDKSEKERIAFALAEYNAGLGRVLNWLPNGRATTVEEFNDAITIPSVRGYIETVTDYYEQYRADGRL